VYVSLSLASLIFVSVWCSVVDNLWACMTKPDTERNLTQDLSTAAAMRGDIDSLSRCKDNGVSFDEPTRKRSECLPRDCLFFPRAIHSMKKSLKMRPAIFLKKLWYLLFLARACMRNRDSGVQQACVMEQGPSLRDALCSGMGEGRCHSVSCSQVSQTPLLITHCILCPCLTRREPRHSACCPKKISSMMNPCLEQYRSGASVDCTDGDGNSLNPKP